MKFDYRESGDGYLVRLEYSEQRIETIPKVGEKLTGNQQAILECMQQNPSVAAKEIPDTL